MHEISAVALFCSDVRQERAGTETLVGVLPDNITLPKYPCAFPQMTVYVRMHLNTSYRPSQILTRLVMPDGSELDRSEIEQALLEQSREKALASGTPYMGLITRFGLAPLQVNEPGRLKAIVTVDGVDIVAGSLNCRLPSSAPT
jgi:hypothetical protein